MGSVWVADHLTLETQVAVKFIHADLARRGSELAKRFSREAKVAAKLKSPHVVQTFDHGWMDNGTPYIVMELLEGQCLADRIARAPLSLQETKALVSQVAEVLQRAHAGGIVHRDLKPQNIFLIDSGYDLFAKVLDFGIARHGHVAGDSRVTATGAVLGTPLYMSPELVQSAKEADHHADLWAVAVTAYEALTGTAPFAGETLGAVMIAIAASNFEPVRNLRPEVPDAVDGWFSRALSVERSDRYQTAEEMRDAFLMAADGQIESKRSASTDDEDESSVPHAKTELATPIVVGQQTTRRGVAVDAEEAAPKRRYWGVALIVGLLGAGAALGYRQIGAESSITPAARMDIDVGSVTPQVEPEHNPWIRIEPAPDGPILLGIDWDAEEQNGAAPSTMSGFRPELNVRSPSTPYEIQQHEVTWAEVNSWLDENSSSPGVAEAKATVVIGERGRQPILGLPWETAQAFCKSLGASLPTEAEWEYAARGSERRPYPWGISPLDRTRVRAFAGKDAEPGAIMASEQDRTAGQEPIYDLMGNAQEWTVDLWTDDATGKPPPWSTSDPNRAYRTVRGFPVNASASTPLPLEGAAFRGPLCGEGACIEEAADARAAVGFRCARAAKTQPRK